MNRLALALVIVISATSEGELMSPRKGFEGKGVADGIVLIEFVGDKQPLDIPGADQLIELQLGERKLIFKSHHKNCRTILQGKCECAYLFGLAIQLSGTG